MSIFCRFSLVMVNYLSILHSFGSSFGPSVGRSAVLLIFDLIGDYSLVLRDFSVFRLVFGCTFDLLCTVHFISSWSCPGHCPAWCMVYIARHIDACTVVRSKASHSSCLRPTVAAPEEYENRRPRIAFAQSPRECTSSGTSHREASLS